MLTSRPNLRRFAGTSALLLTERGIRMAVSVGMGVLIARHLGAADFGVLSYLLALGSFLQPVAVFGMDVIGLRLLVAEPERRAQILGCLLLIRATFGLLAMIGTVAAVLLLDGSERAWLAVPIALATLFQASDVFDCYFQAVIDQRWSVRARLVALGIATAGRIALLIVGAPLLWFAWMLAIEAALSAVCLALAYQRRAKLGLGMDRTMLRSLVVTGLPLACAGVLTPLYTRLDQILLDKILGAHEVGIYAVAVRLSECWFIVPGTLVAAIAPLVMEARLRSEGEFRDKLQRLCDLLTWLAIMIGVGGTLLSTPIVSWLFGAEYQRSGEILAVLCWSGLFVSWGLIRSVVITAQGNFTFTLVYTAIGAVLNLALNLLLIPRYGPFGAALALLASHAMCSTVLTMLNSSLRWTLDMQLRSLLPIRAAKNLIRGGWQG